MTTKWQIRHDIDKVSSMADELERLLQENDVSDLRELISKFYDSSEIDVNLANVDGSLTTLQTSLTTLRGNLVDFNKVLIDFNGDTQTIETDLSKLKDNLSTFLTSVDGFVDDLGDLSVDLGDLTTQMNAAKGTFNSLGDRLAGLDGNLSQLDIDLGSLGSDLSGIYDDLYDASGNLKVTVEDITRLSTELSGLVEDLDNLGSVLVNFEGDLDDFKEAVEEEGIDLNTFSLNSNILEVFGAIGTVKSHITVINEETIPTVQGDIGNVQKDIYGEDSHGDPITDPDDKTPDSLLGRMETVQTETIPGVQLDIKDTKIDLYGADGQGEPLDWEHRSDSSVIGLVETATDEIVEITEETIPAVQESVDVVQKDVRGDPDNPLDGGLIGSVIGNYTPGSNPTYTRTVSSITTVNQNLADPYRIKLTDNSSVAFIRSGTDSQNQIKLYLNQGNLELSIMVDNSWVIEDVVVRTGFVDVFSSKLAYNSHIIDVSSIETSNLYQINGTINVFSLTEVAEGLIPQVETVQSDITTVQEDIGDVTQLSGDLVSEIQTNIDNIDDAQLKIGEVNVSRDGNLQTQLFNVQSIADLVVAINSSWQLLWAGYIDRINLDALITSTGLQFQNIHYAYYNGQFKVNDGISWQDYDEDVILDKVDFACAICGDFTPAIKSSMEDLNIVSVYDLSEKAFYHFIADEWVKIENMEYSDKMCLMVMFDVAPLDINSHLLGNLQLQSDINAELYNQLTHHNHVKSDISDLNRIAIGSDSFNFVWVQSLPANSGDVYVYANNYEIYIKFTGTISISANSNTVLGKLAEPYRPITGYEYGIIGHQSSDIYGAVSQEGILYIVNKTSSTSITTYGSIRYPRKQVIDVITQLSNISSSPGDTIIKSGDLITLSVTARERQGEPVWGKKIIFYG